MRNPTPAKILVSACLLGCNCAYDGLSRSNPRTDEFCRDRSLVTVCPEMLGGLGCPRERHEIFGGSGEDVIKGSARVVSVSGVDRTREFVKGAEEALRIANQNNCRLAILKENSPSCGVKYIHSGKFNSVRVSGQGVTAAMFTSAGIRVIADTEL